MTTDHDKPINESANPGGDDIQVGDIVILGASPRSFQFAIPFLVLKELLLGAHFTSAKPECKYRPHAN